MFASCNALGNSESPCRTRPDIRFVYVSSFGFPPPSPFSFVVASDSANPRVHLSLSLLLSRVTHRYVSFEAARDSRRRNYTKWSLSETTSWSRASREHVTTSSPRRNGLEKMGRWRSQRQKWANLIGANLSPRLFAYIWYWFLNSKSHFTRVCFRINKLLFIFDCANLNTLDLHLVSITKI